MGRIRGPPACFLQFLWHGVARCAGLDYQQTDTLSALPSGTHGTGDQICPAAAGNKCFAAVNEVIVIFSHGRGLQTGHVRSASGLGNGQGCYFVTHNDGTGKTLFLLVRSVAQNGRNGNIQWSQTGGNAAGSTSHDFFPGSDLKENIPGGATVFLRVADSQDADVTGFFIKIAGKFIQFFPFVNIRNYFLIDEFLYRSSNHIMGAAKVLLIVGCITEFKFH